jgi:hypothetical protein
MSFEFWCYAICFLFFVFVILWSIEHLMSVISVTHITQVGKTTPSGHL